MFLKSYAKYFGINIILADDSKRSKKGELDKRKCRHIVILREREFESKVQSLERTFLNTLKAVCVFLKYLSLNISGVWSTSL